MVHPVRNIVIVGGGTAGWLTAGIIAARHRTRIGQGFSVTLVESPNTPIIGVGEGTWPTLRTTLSRMGVSESDFFRECDGIRLFVAEEIVDGGRGRGGRAEIEKTRMVKFQLGPARKICNQDRLKGFLGQQKGMVGQVG